MDNVRHVRACHLTQETRARNRELTCRALSISLRIVSGMSFISRNEGRHSACRALSISPYHPGKYCALAETGS